MKNDLMCWIEQIVSTILFFVMMALVAVVMFLVFPDPTLWK